MSPVLETVALWQLIAQKVVALGESRSVSMEPVPTMYPSDPKLPLMRNIVQNLYSIANP